MSPRNIPPPPLTKPPSLAKSTKSSFHLNSEENFPEADCRRQYGRYRKKTASLTIPPSPKKFHSDPKLYRILISALAINHKLQTQCGEEDVPTKVVVAMKWGYKQNPNQVNDGNQKELFVQGTEMKHHKNALF